MNIIVLSLYVKSHLFQLQLLLLLLIDYSKHLLNHLVAATMTLTSTYCSIVQAICYCIDNAIAGIMLILNAVIRIGHNVKWYQQVKYVAFFTFQCNQHRPSPQFSNKNFGCRRGHSIGSVNWFSLFRFAFIWK
jgi:hypothetical protein